MSVHRRGVAVFLVLTFSLTWFIELVPLRRVRGDTEAYALTLIGVMFIPTLSALIVRGLVERSGFAEAGLRWGRGFRWYLMAWLLPAAVGWAAMLLAVILRQAEWDPHMTELLARMQVSYPQMKMPPLRTIQIGVLAAAFTWAIIPNTLAAFGEEFGWRGYLLLRLQPLGNTPALLITGLIWGVWHAPIIAQGHNFPDHPLLGVPIMVGAGVFLGVMLGWFRLASGSIFPAAVGHGSVNGPASAPLVFLRGRNDITTGSVGMLAQAVMLVLAVGLWRFGAWRIEKPVSGGEKDACEPVPEQSEQ